MAWTVYVDQKDPLRRSARLWIVENRGMGEAALDPQGVLHIVDPMEQVPDEWAWTLPYDALLPLHSALAAHLGAVESPLALRKDYDAERARVDKFIDAVIAAGGIPS